MPKAYQHVLPVIRWGVSMGFALSGVVNAETQQPICSLLAGLWLDGTFKRYSIPFEQHTPDELIYKVDIDNDGKLDEIRAICGNGSDASCEISVTFKEIGSIEFGLPATIRLIKFHSTVYVVNGVIIGHDGVVSFSNYMVHKISKTEIEPTCKINFEYFN